jgi:hypothetical protein
MDFVPFIITMDDHNQERKCDGISPVAFKTDRNHNSINTNTPDGKTGNKRNTGSQPEEKSNVTKPMVFLIDF